MQNANSAEDCNWLGSGLHPQPCRRERCRHQAVIQRTWWDLLRRGLLEAGDQQRWCDLHYNACRISHRSQEIGFSMQKRFVSSASPKERNQLSEPTTSEYLQVSVLRVRPRTLAHVANSEQGKAPWVYPFPAHEWSGESQPTKNFYHYFPLHVMFLDRSF